MITIDKSKFGNDPLTFFFKFAIQKSYCGEFLDDCKEIMFYPIQLSF